MTIGEIEKQARTILLDTNEDGFRFTPTEMFLSLKTAIKRSRTMRPESKYVDCRLTGKPLLVDGDEADFVVPTSFHATINGRTFSLEAYRGIELNMESRWEEALVYFVVHQMYMKDDADTTNANLAATYYNYFTTSLSS